MVGPIGTLAVIASMARGKQIYRKRIIRIYKRPNRDEAPEENCGVPQFAADPRGDGGFWSASRAWEKAYGGRTILIADLFAREAEGKGASNHPLFSFGTRDLMAGFWWRGKAVDDVRPMKDFR